MPDLPTDTQLLRDQVDGLKAAIKALRKEEDALLRAAGLDEAAEKADQEALALGKTAAERKAALDVLKARRTEAVAVTARALAASMGDILPEGEAVFTVDDSGLFLGWKKADGRTRPHAGLSGGERVIFDAALSYALLGQAEHRALILEAAEVDPRALENLLGTITGNAPGAQIIVLTCHPMEKQEQSWLGDEGGWTIIDTTMEAAQ